MELYKGYIRTSHPAGWLKLKPGCSTLVSACLGGQMWLCAPEISLLQFHTASWVTGLGSEMGMAQ